MTRREIWFPHDVWLIIKEFMPVWKDNHKRKLNMCLQPHIPKKKYNHGLWNMQTFVGIKTLYPKTVLWEKYNLRNKLYTTTFRVPWRPSQLSETRVTYKYNVKENNWSCVFIGERERHFYR